MLALKIHESPYGLPRRLPSLLTEKPDSRVSTPEPDSTLDGRTPPILLFLHPLSLPFFRKRETRSFRVNYFLHLSLLRLKRQLHKENAYTNLLSSFWARVSGQSSLLTSFPSVVERLTSPTFSNVSKKIKAVASEQKRLLFETTQHLPQSAGEN